MIVPTGGYAEQYAIERDIRYANEISKTICL